eukprot:Awhi_evm1s13668
MYQITSNEYDGSAPYEEQSYYQDLSQSQHQQPSYQAYDQVEQQQQQYPSEIDPSPLESQYESYSYQPPARAHGLSQQFQQRNSAQVSVPTQPYARPQYDALQYSQQQQSQMKHQQHFVQQEQEPPQQQFAPSQQQYAPLRQQQPLTQLQQSLTQEQQEEIEPYLASSISSQFTGGQNSVQSSSSKLRSEQQSQPHLSTQRPPISDRNQSGLNKTSSSNGAKPIHLEKPQQKFQKKKKTKKKKPKAKRNAQREHLILNNADSHNTQHLDKKLQNGHLPSYNEVGNLRNANSIPIGKQDPFENKDLERISNNPQYDDKRRHDDYIQRMALLPPDERTYDGNINSNRDEGRGNGPRSCNSSYDDRLPADAAAFNRAPLSPLKGEPNRNFRFHSHFQNEDDVYNNSQRGINESNSYITTIEAPPISRPRPNLDDDIGNNFNDNSRHREIRRDYQAERRIYDSAPTVSSGRLNDHRESRFDDRRPLNSERDEGNYNRARSLSTDRDFNQRRLGDEAKRRNGQFLEPRSQRAFFPDLVFDDRRQEGERRKFERKEEAYCYFDEPRRYNEDDRGPRAFEDDGKFRHDWRLQKEERERHLHRNYDDLDRQHFINHGRRFQLESRTDPRDHDIRELESRIVEEDLRLLDQMRREEEIGIRNRRPSQDYKDIHDNRDIHHDRNLRRSPDFRDIGGQRRSQDLRDDRRSLQDTRRGSQDIGDNRRRSQDFRDDRRGSQDFRDDRRGLQDFRDDFIGSQDVRDDRRLSQDEGRPRIFLRDSASKRGPNEHIGRSPIEKRDRDRDREVSTRDPLIQKSMNPRDRMESKQEKFFPIQPWTHQKTQPKYMCEDCKVLFLTWQKCLLHLKEKKHCGMPGGSMKGLQQRLGKENLINTSKTKFICYDCFAEYPHWNGIANHVRKYGHCQERHKSKTITSKTDVFQRLSANENGGVNTGKKKKSVMQRLAPSKEKKSNAYGAETDTRDPRRCRPR